MATPTPTQAELNKIALGESVTLADDGSGADPNVFTLDHRAAPKAAAPVRLKRQQGRRAVHRDPNGSEGRVQCDPDQLARSSPPLPQHRRDGNNRRSLARGRCQIDARNRMS